MAARGVKSCSCRSTHLADLKDANQNFSDPLSETRGSLNVRVDDALHLFIQAARYQVTRLHLPHCCDTVNSAVASRGLGSTG